MAKASGKTAARKGAAGNKTTVGKPTVNVTPADNMSIARRIAWWSLLAMVFLVPIAMGNWTWLSKLGFTVVMPFSYDQFDIVKVFLQRVLGLVALGAWSWDMLTKGGKIRRTPVDWLILAFLVWVTITTFTSIHPATAFFGKYRRFEGLLSFINYAVIYFLVMQFADRPSRVLTLAKTLFWSSVIVAGYGVLQSIGADPVQWGALPFEQFRPFSTYGNPDLLGGFLMFSLPVALALALAEENLTMRMVYWVGFGANAYVWIVAFTRGAWIGGAVSLVIVGIIAWRHSAKMRGVDWIPAGLIAALGTTAIVRSLSNPNEVMNFGKRFASITQFDGGSGKTRTEIWQAAFDAIKDRPIFGYGADTFRLVFPKYKPFEYVKDAGYLSVADNVHNYPLQLAAGIGILGMLMLYGIFAWAAVRSFGTVFGKTDDRKRLLIGAFWAACAGYLVQLMFGLSVTGNTFLLWTSIAVVLAPTASVVEFKAPNWGIAAGAIVLVLVAVGLGYQFVYMAADNAYLKARIGLRGEARTAAARRAVQLNPYNDMYRAEVGLALTDELIDTLTAANQAQQSGQDMTPYLSTLTTRFAAAESALRDTINFVPWEYDNYVFLANLYNLGGQSLNPEYFKRGLEIANKGIEVEPFGPAIRTQKARALIGMNKPQDAVKDLEFAVKLDPAYAEGALLLAQVYEGLGRTSDAIAVLRITEAVKPGQSGIATTLQRLEASTSTVPATSTP